MAFDARNVGKCGSDGTGAIRVFTYHTTVDAIATVVASGYFNTYASQIRTGDIIICSATDVTRICRMVNTANVITTNVAVSLA